MEKFCQCGEWQAYNHVYVNVEKRRGNGERKKKLRGRGERERRRTMIIPESEEHARRQRGMER